MSEYIERVVDGELDEFFGALPAIALEGARAVGKTETARRRARTTYQLDEDAERVIAEAESGHLPSLVTLSVRVFAQAAEARVLHLRLYSVPGRSTSSWSDPITASSRSR